MAKQDQTDKNRAETTRAFVEVVFDDAYQIREELYGNAEDGTPGLFGRRKANREQLRGFSDQGYLSPEQIEEMNELYPPRSKAEESEEEATGEPVVEPEPANA